MNKRANEKELRAVQDDLARGAIEESDVESGDHGKRHCALQVKFWRLRFALAAAEHRSRDDKTRVKATAMLKEASNQAEMWEKRHQHAAALAESRPLPAADTASTPCSWVTKAGHCGFDAQPSAPVTGVSLQLTEWEGGGTVKLVIFKGTYT